jgi:type II secretory pathway pseudopilin PulG
MVVLPAVAVVGALAAIAIPNFVKARTTSQENACINNLRLIDAAKQQWALQNRKQSTDTPTMKELQPFLGRGANGEFPTCPAGGTYTIGSVGEKPTCSVAGHVLP